MIRPRRTGRVSLIVPLIAITLLLGSYSAVHALPTYLPERHIHAISGAPSVFMRVVAISSLDYRPTDLDCSPEAVLSGSNVFPHLRLLEHLDEIRQEAQAAGDLEPLIIVGGDMFFPDPLVRFMIDEGRGDLLGKFLGRAGVDAVVLGYQDFAGPRRYLQAVLDILQEASIPVLSTNLEWSEERPLPPGVMRSLVLQRDGIGVGLVGVVPQSVPGTVDGRNINGLSFQSSVRRASAEAARLRGEEGADLVIVAGQMDGEQGGLARIVSMGRSLENNADLLVASSVYGQDMGTTIRSLAIHGGPPVLGVPRAMRGLARADLELAMGDSGPNVVWHRTRIINVEGGDEGGGSERLFGLSSRKRRHGIAWNEELSLYCERWGAPFPGIAVDKLQTRETFIDYVLNLLRFQSRTEVSFVNQYAFGDEALFPREEQLTLDFIHQAIPYDSRLVGATVTGRWLENLVRRSAAAEANGNGGGRLVFSGVEIVDNQVLVNKRPIQPDLQYSVSTIEFIATGGNNHLNSGELDFVPVPGHAEGLRDLLLRRLARRQPIHFGTERDFPDLAHRFRWRSDFSLGGGVTSVSIHRCPEGGGCYGKPQLSRDQFFGINSNLRYSLSADTRDHNLRSTIEARYAANKPEGAEEYSRTDDLAAVELVYRWAYLRNSAPPGSFYVPLPSVAQRLETEFNPEDPASRHLESSSSIGLRFDLTSRLEGVASFAARRELLRDEDFSLGLELGYNLQRMQVVELLDTPFHLESQLVYFHSLTGPEQRMVRLDNRISFALRGPIFFNVGFSLFGFREGDGPFASSLDTTAGIRFDWTTSRQTF